MDFSWTLMELIYCDWELIKTRRLDERWFFERFVIAL
ncbi:hypothetical protein COLO4_22737 [Corchorus olitorius]|uniref:Uncharacterized protein n=1 Tax=Corchorus olitorius TaxID=93759 RepID=A0A1R3IKB6_9ROSI|nr:hypothetical protein COLO4_22737 [Corchorus olitorius]